MTAGWRVTPAIMALDNFAARTWMTIPQFEQWQATHFPLGTKRGRAMESEVGISKQAALRRRSGGFPIQKTEALACAHYALGFPMPDAIESTEAFGAWFAPRFGVAQPINDWLDLGRDSVAAVLRGYMLRGDLRYNRPPTADLVRALDWVWRVGPVCPWTSRGFPIFEGQAVAP